MRKGGKEMAYQWTDGEDKLGGTLIHTHTRQQERIYGEGENIVVTGAKPIEETSMMRDVHW